MTDRLPTVSSKHGCCAPTADHGQAPADAIATSEDGPAAAGDAHDRDMVRIPGGACLMGNGRFDGYPGDGEGPVHRVSIKPFRLDRTTVTNERFAAFVAATGFVTEAERFGWSFVFGGLLPDDFEDTRAVASAPWWRQVYGADWRRPEGPHSTIDERSDHPVVQT